MLLLQNLQEERSDFAYSALYSRSSAILSWDLMRKETGLEPHLAFDWLKLRAKFFEWQMQRTWFGTQNLVKNWVRPLVMSTFTLTVLLSLSSGYILTENAYRVFFPFSWEKGFKKPLERGSKFKWGVGWVKSAGDHEIFMYCFKDSGWIIFLQFFFNLETITLRHRIKHQKVLVYH